eukprot:1194708-Prorocentrum_minimum.AAC.4
MPKRTAKADAGAPLDAFCLSPSNPEHPHTVPLYLVRAYMRPSLKCTSGRHAAGAVGEFGGSPEEENSASQQPHRQEAQ